MRILHVINSVDTGGAQTLVEGLIEQMNSLNTESHVLVLLGPGVLSRRIAKHAQSVTYMRLPNNPLALPLGLVRMRIAVNRIRPDLIHSHLSQADLLTALTPGFPSISTVHTTGGHESGAVSRLVSRAVGRLSTRFSRVVACSPMADAYARNVYRRKPDLTIMNGTRINGHRRSRSAPKTILSLSRWHPMKDHKTLFAALQLLGSHAPRLVCAGNGMDPTNKDLGKLLEQFPDLDIELHGAIDDVDSQMARAKALIISSSHGEALPMAGIEALGAGLPVVTTDVGDCRLLAIRPELVVPPGSPDELAEAIALVLESGTESEEAASGLALRLFDISKAAEEYLVLYHQIVVKDPDT